MTIGEEEDINVLVDEIWATFLDKLEKRVVQVARSELGDEVNLYVPQTRILLPIYANPRFLISIYTSSYLVARRNAYTIMRKLGMPPDYFWKFDSWTDERAFEVLSKVTNRIFREIMRINKEGILSVENVSVELEAIKIILNLEDCVECSGIEANHPICYYHAGTFTGIISGLLGKELDGYETRCCATGGEKCEFLIVNRGGEELEKYLNPGKIEFSLHKRLKDVLEEKILRGLGNEVNLRYYQLVEISGIITNPKMFSTSSYEVGIEYGKRLISFLEKYYAKKEEELFDAILQYYSLLKHLRIEIKEGFDEIRAKEVAEISGIAKKEEFLGFLFGELEGVLSALTKEKVVYAGNTFEGDDLVIKFKRYG